MRVKKGVKARRRRNSILKLAKGFRGRRKNCYKRANQAVERALDYAVARPSAQEARLPLAVDRPHQRRGPRAGLVVLEADRRADEGEGRHRPEDPRRSRRARSGGLRRRRRRSPRRPEASAKVSK